jgi:hypothetical protein
MSTDKLPRYTNGNESFGLTDEEYEFLQDDINQAIAEGNEKYGYGGCGNISEDGNHYPFPDNDKPKKLSCIPKPKVKPKRPSVEEVAIARGLLHVIKPKPKSKTESSEARQ